MKYLIPLFFIAVGTHVLAQQNGNRSSGFQILKTGSRIQSLNLAITHVAPTNESHQYPVLFIHGASFPTALAAAFKIEGYSWMEYMASNGYDVYGLDFLGYGNSDRYPEMSKTSPLGKSLGRASEVFLDVGKAVQFVLTKTGKNKIHLVAHSWGATVAALYTSHFPARVHKLVMFAPITQRNDTTRFSYSGNMYESMTPAARINGMRSLAPAERSVLEADVLNHWGSAWLETDTLRHVFKDGLVRFPSGANNDIDDLSHGKPYYKADSIKSPTLIIRGEWDRYPSNEDAGLLFVSLKNAPYKKYVVIENGTHVLHLEKSRTLLFKEVLNFLQDENRIEMQTKKQVAVIFEVIPSKGKKDEYLSIAAALRQELDKINGFISIERFQSLSDPDKILSLSFWSDEEAVKQWRNTELHRLAQLKGRNGIFKDYRLRVVSVIRDYGMFDRAEAPIDSKAVHDIKK